MDFFPPPPEPVRPAEIEEPPQPPWAGAPEDMLAGVVPVELLLGRSDSTVVLLTGMRAFPTGLAMSLGVRSRSSRRDLHSEVFDGPYAHDMDAQWQQGRLKWGFELADGRRVTNVDRSAWDEQPSTHAEWTPIATSTPWQPDRPVLSGGGGGGGMRSLDRDYWLWPLPPAGPLRVVCQWLDQGIELTAQDLDAGPFLAAAERARPVWSAG